MRVGRGSKLNISGVLTKMFGEVGFPALEISFNGRVFKNVIHHEARIGFEAEELHGFVERHEEPVKPLAFEELLGISEGFQRCIPGGGKHITFIGKEAARTVFLLRIAARTAVSAAQFW